MYIKRTGSDGNIRYTSVLFHHVHCTVCTYYTGEIGAGPLSIVTEITLLRAGRLAAVLEFAFFQVCEAIPEFLSPSSTITVPA